MAGKTERTLKRNFVDVLEPSTQGAARGDGVDLPQTPSRTGVIGVRSESRSGSASALGHCNFCHEVCTTDPLTFGTDTSTTKRVDVVLIDSTRRRPQPQLC